MTEDITEADKAMIQALAEVVLIERISKLRVVTGADKKGRTTTARNPEFPDPTPAEQKWIELQKRFGTTGYTPRSAE